MCQVPPSDLCPGWLAEPGQEPWDGLALHHWNILSHEIKRPQFENRPRSDCFTNFVSIEPVLISFTMVPVMELLSCSFGIRALLVANRVAAATGSNRRGAFERRNGFKGLFFGKGYVVVSDRRRIEIE